MLYPTALVAGYLVGSFPTGYVAVRLLRGKDIRDGGSGKTGGFNAFTVTGSKGVAIGVGVADGVKGLAVSAAGWMFWPENPMVQGAAIVGVLLGHNYPVWLQFKGGRGLATVAGALFVLSHFLVLVWCVTWFVAYKVSKDILKANITASVVSIPVVWAIPDGISRMLMTRSVDPGYHAWLITLICVLLLVGHIDAIRSLLSPSGEKRVERE